ncbi:MAG: acyl-CoA dehydratase activase [Desulfatiglans sp.]|jgi:predicted CoA-substrate-specific enzyme activase|nr:acyl-CoA dehydratase activase [Thermodesulfobacteriota bacterium]MEE4351236.1 acyl-CoA dehydratase activase [Desulfatiglans sp.]
MLVMGVDIGAAASKTLILDDDKTLGYGIVHTGADVTETAYRVANIALKEAKVSMNDLDFVMSTGWGRFSVDFAHKQESEVICHAAGAHRVIPEARGVIDIGGQDSKAILMDEDGLVSDFIMNDKCAAGTGRFVETLCNILEIELEDVGNLALKGENPCLMTSACVVFAETEVVAYRAQKRSIEDIVAGVMQSLVKRVYAMACHIRLDRLADTIVFTGGTAKNPGLVKYLERETQTPLLVPEEPQIVGALGAALIAEQELALQ